MKVGITLAKYDWDGAPNNLGPKFTEIAQSAESNDFDSVWVMDHFFQLEGMLGNAEDLMIEGYTTLGYLAHATKHVMLGTLVTGVIYRNPGLLVKAMTTLDVLSGGRTYFGIGAGWYEREAKGLGFPFGTFTDRFERLEEVLQITKQMWANDTSPYRGKHYQMEEPICSPQPLSKPHPPIMVGGNGEKKTLKFVAKYGDACNLLAMNGVQEVQHKLDVLKKHCETEGRDYAEIEKTALTFADLSQMKSSDVVNLCKSFADVGIEHLIFGVSNYWELTPLETFGKEIIPEVKSL